MILSLPPTTANFHMLSSILDSFDVAIYENISYLIKMYDEIDKGSRCINLVESRILPIFFTRTIINK